MPCTEASCPRVGALTAAAVATTAATVLLLAACGSPPAPPGTASRAPGMPATPSAPTTPGAAPGTSPGAAGSTQAPRHVSLPAPATPRTQLELQHQVARRLVAAHPDTSYTSRAPDRLLAIPVLEIELNGDGSVRRIDVLRHPKTGNQATRLAIEAVHRAAPYGRVSHLPRPWKVVETFLFDDTLRFKPRILDTP